MRLLKLVVVVAGCWCGGGAETNDSRNKSKVFPQRNSNQWRVATGAGDGSVEDEHNATLANTLPYPAMH